MVVNTTSRLMVSLRIITAGRKVLQATCLVKDKQFGRIEKIASLDVAGQASGSASSEDKQQGNGSGSTPEQFRRVRFRRM